MPHGYKFVLEMKITGPMWPTFLWNR